MRRTSKCVRPAASVLGLLGLATITCCAPGRRPAPIQPPIGEAPAEPFDGKKARVAVARFGDKTGQHLEGVDFGTGMKDMLATALLASNRFVVVEALSAADVIEEQELGGAGTTERTGAAPLGAVEGPELLITGAVTEFEASARGGPSVAPSRVITLLKIGQAIAGKAAGAVTFGLADMVVGAVADSAAGLAAGIVGTIRRARIAIDLRLIDTRTSRILSAIRAEATATDVDPRRLLKQSSWLGRYAQTPMEQAVRVAIDQGVEYLAAATPDQYFDPTTGTIDGAVATPAHRAE